MNGIVQSSFGIGFLGVCYGLYRVANGRLTTVEKALGEKIDRPACHQAQKGITDQIKTLDKHTGDRFDDLKEFIKNGK